MFALYALAAVLVVGFVVFLWDIATKGFRIF